MVKRNHIIVLPYTKVNTFLKHRIFPGDKRETFQPSPFAQRIFFRKCVEIVNSFSIP